MTLRGFLVKRLVYTIFLILFTIIINWIIFEAMPGLQNQLYTVLANPKRTSDIQYQKLVDLYGLNKSPLEQFLDYFRALLTFQFGFSYSSGANVSTEIITSGRLFNTLILLGSSTLISIVIGVLIGIWGSYKRGSFTDNFWVSSSLAMYSLPTFFIGIVLILVFADGLGWFPPGSTVPSSWSLAGQLPSLPIQILVRLQYLFLPALTLTLIGYGGFVLLTRATMLETLSEDYITTARAKGLPERVVLLRHAFKNASLPVITASALAFGTILGGAIITETVFNLNGLGKWLFDSVLQKDYPVMAAMFYIIALTVIFANFISDILYGIVDPRIRYE